VVEVEQWAEIRRMHFVACLSIKEIARRTGRDRNTVRRVLRSEEPPRYRRAQRPSKLDPFREEIHRLLREDGELPGQVIRERLQELGYQGGKTILDDYLREIRPIVAPPRTFQRTVYRPGRICQFDLWEPSDKVPVGSSTVAPGWWSRAWATRARAPAR
jgi:transposase